MIFFAVPALFIAGLIGAAFTFPWRSAQARHRLPVLAVLALPPIAAAVWGRVFAVQPGSNPTLPFWIEGFLALQLAASVILAILFVSIMAGVRGFALSVGLTAVAATLVVAFLAVMQVSGSWI